MFRATLKPNKILDKKWNKIMMEQHQAKLRTIRPTINTHRNDPKLTTSARRPKNERHFVGINYLLIAKARFKQIERENMVFLDKMSKIMRASSTCCVTRSNIKCQVDKKIDSPRKSLNRENRKKELIKITIENQVLFAIHNNI